MNYKLLLFTSVFVFTQADSGQKVAIKSECSEQRNRMPSRRGSGTLSLRP